MDLDKIPISINNSNPLDFITLYIARMNRQLILSLDDENEELKLQIKKLKEEQNNGKNS